MDIFLFFFFKQNLPAKYSQTPGGVPGGHVWAEGHQPGCLENKSRKAGYLQGSLRAREAEVSGPRAGDVISGSDPRRSVRSTHVRLIQTPE